MTLNKLLIQKNIEKEAKKLGIDLTIIIDNKNIKIVWMKRNTLKNTKGNGSKLIKYIINIADETDLDIIFDVDATDSQLALIEYYKKHGFHITKYYEMDDDIEHYMLKDEYSPTKFYPLMKYKHN